MALYVKAETTWLVADSSAAAQTSSSRSSSTIDTTTSTLYTEHLISLADSVTDQAVNFGTVTTAKSARIQSDRQISVKINGGDTGVIIGNVATVGWTLQLDATAITSLSLTNASGGAASVKIQLPGV